MAMHKAIAAACCPEALTNADMKPSARLDQVARIAAKVRLVLQPRNLVQFQYALPLVMWRHAILLHSYRQQANHALPLRCADPLAAARAGHQ